MRRTDITDRNGVVLVIVLVVIALLALSAYTFSEMMLAEHSAVQVHGDLMQSHEATMSGVAMIQAFLLQEPATRNQQGGLYDNPNYFAQQAVAQDEQREFQTLFSILSTMFDNEGYPTGLRYGLENESARLNLNWLLELSARGEEEEEANGGEGSGGTAGPANDDDGGGQPPPPPPDGEDGDTGGGRDSGGGGSGGGGSGGGDSGGGESGGSDAGATNATDTETDAESGGDPARDGLMAMPGMTLQLADAILDWIDADDEPREFGAEIDYYSSLDPPYKPRNGPLTSVDELLMVRDVTPDLLFGRDRNRNGMIDENEVDLPIFAEVDESLGSIDLGWSAYLTVHSRELNLSPLGEERIDLNGDDLEELHDELSAVVDADWATFIVAYRQHGPADSEEDGEAVGGRTVDLSQPGRNSIKSVLDLVGAKVQLQLEGEDDPVLFASPFPNEPGALASSLDTLLDYATTDSDEVITGRININEAPRPVLLAIPGMTDDVVGTILSQRIAGVEDEDSVRRHPTWLLTQGFVDLETMKEMQPYVTTGGDVYRAQVVGYFGNGRAVSRVEVVLDSTRPDIPVLIWNDRTYLGRGFDPSSLVGGAQ